MPQMAHPDEILLSGLNYLSSQKSNSLYRPCPDTQTTFLHRCVEEGDAKDKDSENKKYNFNKKSDDKKEKENTLQEAVRRIAKAKKVF